MANRIDAYRRGLGTVPDILQAYPDVTAGECDPASISAACNVLSASMKLDGEPGRMAKAMLCSVLNREFETTGRLWSINSNGTIAYAYYSVGDERNTVLELMSP